MLELLNKINESGLSPNQYFLIFAIRHKVELKNLDLDKEKEMLEAMGYLKDGELIDDSIVSKHLSEQALRMKAIQFSQIFPPVILNTGVHARGKLAPIRQKLGLFLLQYNYDWDQIYAAANQYINRYKAKGYSYMQNASNFILDKNGDSTLALECDTLGDIVVDEDSI